MKLYINLNSYIKATFSLPLSALLIYGISSSSVPTKIASILIYFLFTTVQYFYGYLKFVCICNKSHISDQYFDWLEPFVKTALKIILLYVICREPVHDYERIIISLLIIGMHLWLVSKLIIDKIQKYDSVLELAQYLGWVVVICYYCVLLLEIEIELVHENRWMMFLSLVVWSGWAVHNVLEHSRNELILKPVEKISSEREAIAYMKLIYKVFDEKR